MRRWLSTASRRCKPTSSSSFIPVNLLEAVMVTIRAEIPADVTAREALLDRAFGPARHRKTSQRMRDDRLPAEGLAFTALSKSGRVIGTLRMWNVIAGSA